MQQNSFIAKLSKLVCTSRPLHQVASCAISDLLSSLQRPHGTRWFRGDIAILPLCYPISLDTFPAGSEMPPSLWYCHMHRHICAMPHSATYCAIALRLGWPATEWETGPEPKMAGEMAGEMAGGHFSGGSRNGPKNGRTNGWTAKNRPNFGCPAICPAIFRPFRDPPEKWPPAISPAISPAIFGSGPVSHSVAGQPSRNDSRGIRSKPRICTTIATSITQFEK